MSSRHLRIAVLTRAVYPLHGYGGLERHVHDLTRHLLAEGLDVTLITRSFPVGATALEQATHKFLNQPGLAVHLVPYRTFPLAGRRGTTVLDRNTAYPVFGYRAGRAAAALVRAGTVDVVHCHGASGLGYALARRRGHGATAPLILNPHGLEEFGGTDPSRLSSWKRAAYAPLRQAVRACARAADRIIATDEGLEPTVRRHLGVGPERIRVVSNAVDVGECDRLATAEDGARLRARHGFAAGEPLLLSVGRIEVNKGFDTLAAALGEVRDLSWRWVLIGDGSHRGQLERVVADLGMALRVLFRGRLSDDELHAWYEAATLFVHPTLYEGSAIVALEAMAHRRAVVATLAGGLPDKVRAGRNGWLVRPGDSAGLAAALRDALADPDRLNRMGVEGRAIVEGEFSWRSVTRRLLAVYDDVLEEVRDRG